MSDQLKEILRKLQTELLARVVFFVLQGDRRPFTAAFDQVCRLHPDLEIRGFAVTTVGAGETGFAFTSISPVSP